MAGAQRKTPETCARRLSRCRGIRIFLCLFGGRCAAFPRRRRSPAFGVERLAHDACHASPRRRHTSEHYASGWSCQLTEAGGVSPNTSHAGAPGQRAELRWRAYRHTFWGLGMAGQAQHLSSCRCSVLVSMICPPVVALYSVIVGALLVVRAFSGGGASGRSGRPKSSIGNNCL